MPVKKTAKTQKGLIIESLKKIDIVRKIPKSKVLIIVGILITAGLLFYFKSLFIAATVNGQPISRLSLISELDKQGGKRTLETIITKTLILQEAQKKNASISQQEIDNELKKIEDSLSKQGQNLDQALVSQGMTKSDLTEQIKLQKLIEKMVGKDIKITDKEINDYITQNKDSLGENASSENTGQQVSDQLKQQKLSDKIQTWIGNLQQNAKISYFIKY